MPKPTQKKTRKSTSAKTNTGASQGIIAGLTSFWRRTCDSAFGNTVANATRFTRSGVVTLGSFTWYAVVTVMVVVFPIRRAVEMEALMEEDRQRQAMQFNPDAVLPIVPGVYNGGPGSSSVPITPQYQ
eukprot:Phypoly_transcript_19491.p2 GENE.Phypoly_transcript_19491~~Phypoly_transcript_19491.p2  ORF type:complete len:128 (-),score=22.61 Phypoly_transcript_19491:72-455(-)